MQDVLLRWRNPRLAGQLGHRVWSVFSDRIVRWSLLTRRPSNYHCVSPSLELRNWNKKWKINDFILAYLCWSSSKVWLIASDDLQIVLTWWNFRFVQRLRLRLFPQQGGGPAGPARAGGSGGRRPRPRLRLAEGGRSPGVQPGQQGTTRPPQIMGIQTFYKGRKLLFKCAAPALARISP